MSEFTIVVLAVLALWAIESIGSNIVDSKRAKYKWTDPINPVEDEETESEMSPRAEHALLKKGYAKYKRDLKEDTGDIADNIYLTGYYERIKTVLDDLSKGKSKDKVADIETIKNFIEVEEKIND